MSYMSKEKIEMKTNGTYTFTSNAAWHWKEQFRREPRMAISGDCPLYNCRGASTFKCETSQAGALWVGGAY